MSSELNFERRFGSLNQQLNLYQNMASRETPIDESVLQSALIAIKSGMGLAGINPEEGTVKGDYLGTEQKIIDQNGKQYSFKQIDTKLTIEKDGKRVIDPEAVKELKEMTAVAERIAKRFITPKAAEEMAQQVARNARAAGQKAGEAMHKFVHEEFPAGTKRFGEDLKTGATIVAAGVVATIAFPVGLIVGAGIWIEKELQPLSKSLGEAFEPLLRTLEGAVNATGEKLKEAATTIRNGLQTMANQINTHVVEPYLRPLYEATLAPVLALLNKVIGDVYRWSGDNVYPKLVEAAQDLATVATRIATITTTAATWLFITAPLGAYKNAKAGLEAAGAEISRIAHNTYTSAAEKLTSAGKTIRETFEKLPGQAQEAARLAYNDTVAALTKARDAIKEFGTGTDAAWQRNVQPHLDKVGEAIKKLDNDLGGYGGYAAQKIGEAIQATGHALYELGSVAYSRAFGAKLTATEENAIMTKTGELLEVVNTSIQVAVNSAERNGLSAIEDPYIKQMLSEGWLGGTIGAGPRKLLINLQNLVRDRKITVEEFQRRLAGIMKLMPTPLALAEKAPTPVTEALSDPHLYGKTMVIMPEAAAVLETVPSSGRRGSAASVSTATSTPPSPRSGRRVASPSVTDSDLVAAFHLFGPRGEGSPEAVADHLAAREADLGTGEGGLNPSFLSSAPGRPRGSPPPPPFPRSREGSGPVDGSFSDDDSDG